MLVVTCTLDYVFRLQKVRTHNYNTFYNAHNQITVTFMDYMITYYSHSGSILVIIYQVSVTPPHLKFNF